MNKSFFEFMSLSKAKESFTKTSNDIKQCVNADVLECQQQDTSSDDKELPIVFTENASYKEYLYLPPFHDIASCSCDNSSTKSVTGNDSKLHLEQDQYDVAKDQLFISHLLENPLLLNTYKDKLDLYSMRLCETLRQENLKLLVLNSELEARLLQLSAEVTDTNVKLQNAQLDYLHKQKEMQKDFIRIKTSRKMIEVMKLTLDTEVDNLKNDKLNLMKTLKRKQEELSQVNRLNRRLQEKLEFSQKVVESARDEALSSFVTSDDNMHGNEDLVLEIEKLMKSKTLLRSLNDVMTEELNKAKAENEDVNSRLMQLTEQLLAANSELENERLQLEREREKVKSLTPAINESNSIEKKLEEEEQQISETLIENIINNIATTLSLRSPSDKI